MMLSLVHRMSLSPRRLAAHRRCAPSPYRAAKIDPSSRVYTVTPWIGGAVFAERREYSRIILELRLPFFGDLRPLRQSEISGAATNKSTGMGTLYSVGSDPGVSESISTTTRDVFLLSPILSRGIGSLTGLMLSSCKPATSLTSLGSLILTFSGSLSAWVFIYMLFATCKSSTVRSSDSSSGLRCNFSRTPSSICIILYIIHHLSIYVNRGPVSGRRWL